MKIKISILLVVVMLGGCSFETKQDESRIEMEREYNKIQFCKNQGYNYHEIITKEVATEKGTGVSSVELIKGIECDWFSPTSEPNKKIILNSIFKYCKDIGEEQMGTMFDCRELYSDVYFQK